METNKKLEKLKAKAEKLNDIAEAKYDKYEDKATAKLSDQEKDDLNKIWIGGKKNKDLKKIRRIQDKLDRKEEHFYAKAEKVEDKIDKIETLDKMKNLDKMDDFSRLEILNDTNQALDNTPAGYYTKIIGKKYYNKAMKKALQNDATPVDKKVRKILKNKKRKCALIGAASLAAVIAGIAATGVVALKTMDYKSNLSTGAATAIIISTAAATMLPGVVIGSYALVYGKEYSDKLYDTDHKIINKAFKREQKKKQERDK